MNTEPRASRLTWALSCSKSVTKLEPPVSPPCLGFCASARRRPASGASAALLASLPAVSVSLGADVDRVLLPLSLPLGSVLALLLGPQHHVGEGHEHLQRKTLFSLNALFSWHKTAEKAVMVEKKCVLQPKVNVE